MLNFSLMGAGRIGKMHAKFIAAHPKAKLKYMQGQATGHLPGSVLSWHRRCMPAGTALKRRHCPQASALP